MARKPTLNWTPSRKQYTVTVGGRLHHLGADKEIAEKQYDYLMEQADEGRHADPRPTLLAIIDAWMTRFVVPKCSNERARAVKARMEGLLNHLGHKTKVAALRPVHIESWLDSHPKLSLGSRTVYSGMVLAALNWAAGPKVRLISHNPLKGRLALPKGASRGGEALWPPGTFEKVVAAAKPEFADVLRILLWTGARPSTVAQVTAAHYRPKERLWDVEALYAGRVSKKKYVRRVWLPPQAVPIVERLNRAHPEGPIFRNGEGRAWTSARLRDRLTRVKQRLRGAVPVGLTLYGLRHTFATRFLAEHSDKIEYLRELLGHADLQMIRRHYVHLEQEVEAIHQLLNDFNPAGGGAA